MTFEEAVRTRHNGFGMLRQGVDEWRGIKVGMETALAGYALRLGFSRGQIEPYAGEVLYSPGKYGNPLMFRRIGRAEADFCYCEENSPVLTRLAFPEKLALIQYMQGSEPIPAEVVDLRNILNSIHFYHSHYIDLSGLKQRGSESGIRVTLRADCGNLWSVLRNIHGKSAIDSRVMQLLSVSCKKVFPTSKIWCSSRRVQTRSTPASWKKVFETQFRPTRCIGGASANAYPLNGSIF